MILSKQTLAQIKPGNVAVPADTVFDLPVKVLQFGTGVLLRGLPDYLIDKANRNNIFNGRIAVVKSTGGGNNEPFAAQDNLYTVLIKGVDNGVLVQEQVICSAIQHVFFAGTEWGKIMEGAANPHLTIVISNTTEVGIQLVEESIHQDPPASFPAKLLAFLYRRYQVFNGDPERGLVIIPTELLTDNGKVLKEILIRLSAFNKLEEEFVSWLTCSNFFCSSLVDRIVPGKLTAEEKLEFEHTYGYKDDLAINTELYRLWAIEGDEKIKAKLSFGQADDGVIVTPDINLFRELKLRLLNGTHSLSCAVAFFSRFDTVIAAVQNEAFVKFIKQLMADIASSVPYNCAPETLADFSDKVLDRFRNPYIRHLWINIAQQYTTKLKLRIVPVLLEYYRRHGGFSQHMALGFAASFVFFKTEKTAAGFAGFYDNKPYPVNDDNAAYFYNTWQNEAPCQVANTLLKDTLLWGHNLTEIPGFEEAVNNYMNLILAGNIHEAVESMSVPVAG